MLAEERRTQQNKRLAADVPSDVFWEIKAATAEAKLQMREMIPLAVIKFLNLDISAEQLGLNAHTEKYLLDLTEVDETSIIAEGDDD